MDHLPLPDSPLRRRALDLLCALDAYGVACERLTTEWRDMDAYADFIEQILAVRKHSGALPGLAALSLQLVIAHAELVAALWHEGTAEADTARLQEARRHHAAAVNVLRNAATDLLGYRRTA